MPRHRPAPGRVLSRLRAGRARGDGGFVLLESLIAITVITIVMGAVGVEFVSAVAATSQQRARQVAVQLADSEAERVRSLHASDLVLGRDATSVASQFASAPVGVAPWLASMNQISDPAAAFPSGRTAALPTSVSPAAPVTQQTPGSITYGVLDYLGSCYLVPGAAACQQTRFTGSVPYLRDVIAVTWSGPHCTPAACTYVTSMLVSATPDQTFQVNQPLPQAPAIAPVPAQTVAVGDTGVRLQLTVADGTGVAPFTWVLGTLPAGLDYSPTGLISGAVGGSNTGTITVTTTVRVTDAFLRSATATITWTVEPALAISPVTAPAAVVNVAVAPLTLSASGGDGAPYTWSATGLPPGLSLAAASGVISGTPTAVGTYTVRVRVLDKGGARSVTASFPWTITWPPIAVANQVAQTDTVGIPATPVRVSASGGDGGYVWSAGGTLPAGLGIDAATGLISGTPTATGAYAVTVTVRDPSAGASADYTRTTGFTWNVVPAPTIARPPDQVSGQGVAVNLALGATCPNAPCSYTLNGAPDGLGVTSTGVVTGSIGTPGSYPGITVTVTDRQGASATSAAFGWTVTPAPHIAAPVDRTTPRNTAVSLDVSAGAGGGTGALTYSATGLPSGLSIDPATGRITGRTGSSNSRSTVVLTVTDAEGATGTASFVWNVTDLAIAVPDQTSWANTAVRLDLTTLTGGGTAPDTYAITGNPGWLTLNPATGVLGGTPGATGTTNGITVTVRDAAGAVVTSAPFAWAVAPQLRIAVIPDQTTARYGTGSYQVVVSGGAAPYSYRANWGTGWGSWLTIGPTGLITAAPGRYSGSRTGVTVTVTDAANRSVTSNAFDWGIG